MLDFRRFMTPVRLCYRLSIVIMLDT
uniref:Uncharacterized protein n=1 Tax=Arundo donax TaxID=35708 RepID=A0A0A8YYI8_ARUDO